MQVVIVQPVKISGMLVFLIVFTSSGDCDIKINLLMQSVFFRYLLYQ